MTKEYYLYVGGQKIKVSKQIYKVYWQEREHEKYLEQVDKKNHLLFFSFLNQYGNWWDRIHLWAWEHTGQDNDARGCIHSIFWHVSSSESGFAAGTMNALNIAY